MLNDLTNFAQKPDQNNQKPSREKQPDGLLTKNGKKPSRATKQPKAIAELICLLNSLPAELRSAIALPDLRDLSGFDWFPSNSNKGLFEAIEAKVDSYIENWPDPIKQYVEFGVSGGGDDSNLPYRSRYSLWDEEKVGQYNKLRRFDFLVNAYNLLKQFCESPGYRFRILNSPPETVSVDENGCFVFAKSELGKLLEGIEADRIHCCPACYRFFWANPSHKKACSQACSHALRNRIYREKNKDQIKKRRAQRPEKAPPVTKSRRSSNKGKK